MALLQQPPAAASTDRWALPQRRMLYFPDVSRLSSTCLPEARAALRCTRWLGRDGSGMSGYDCTRRMMWRSGATNGDGTSESVLELPRNGRNASHHAAARKSRLAPCQQAALQCHVSDIVMTLKLLLHESFTLYQ